MRQVIFIFGLILKGIVLVLISSSSVSFAGEIFSEDFKGGGPSKNVLLEKGAGVSEEQRYGGVLQLRKDSYASVVPSVKLQGRSGTIRFWIRPMWRLDEEKSHVFLTARWGDHKDGYLAVSYGWWEPLGTGRMYFVVNNQESMHCSAPYRFEQNVWTLITVTWKSGAAGSCRIFVDKEKIAEHLAQFGGQYTTSSALYLGSDLGTTDFRERLSDFDMNGLYIDDRAWNEREIIDWHRARYLELAGKPYEEWQPRPPTLSKKVAERRDENGVLLETRVLFDEDIHWAYSMEAADRILARVKAAGFNVYVPCVWHGRGTHYPTEITAADERLVRSIRAGYDPLKYLISRAHALGIEVHPWITVVRREWSRHPEYYDVGVPNNAYDVHNPEFRDFVVRLMRDLVERYDIDGINLDYIRAMGICDSERCKNDYRNQTGHELKVDTYLSHISKLARERIWNWQSDAVSSIVKRLSAEAKKVKLGLIISVDGNPTPRERQPSLEGRDEILWANHGWIDVIFNMDYRSRIDSDAVDTARALLKDPYKVYPLYGNFDTVDGKPTSRPGKMIERFVEFSRAKWPESGIAFYIFQMLSDEQAAVLKQSVFSEDAKPNWKWRVNQKDVGAALQ